MTIPKEVRDRYGERCRLVELDGGIELVPSPDDPLEALRAAASDELADLEAASRDEARGQTAEL